MQSLPAFFRDDALSDLIGFSYATWHGDDAAANLVQELARAPRACLAGGQHAVLIALDGENAWEHYPFNGYFFLSALYARLSRIRHLSSRRCRSALAREPAPADAERASSPAAGSTARLPPGWAMPRRMPRGICCAMRSAHLIARAFDGEAGRAEARAAERQLALCESSDWFWWFGDYNPADAVAQFDELFRRQLVNLYRMLQVARRRRAWRMPDLGRPRRAGARRCHAPRVGRLVRRGSRTPAGI